MKKAALTLLMLATFSYLYCANIKDMTKITKHFNASHGEAGKGKTKEYRTWAGIIERCTNTNNHKYPDYGGRDIKVCCRWRNSYSDFLSDMGRAPSPKHSIERENNNGNYEPENCRWATRKEQANNRRNSNYFNYNGKTKTLSEFCDMLGLKYGLISRRLWDGWSIERAFTKPSNKNLPVSAIASLDETQVIVIRDALKNKYKSKHIALYFGVSKTTVHRIKKGTMYRGVGKAQEIEDNKQRSQ